MKMTDSNNGVRRGHSAVSFTNLSAPYGRINFAVSFANLFARYRSHKFGIHCG